VARLLVFRGDLVDREIDLGVTSIRIGRGADNDVVLDDPEKGVSRSHAELRHENGRYVLVDLGSQNGIFQDGARVERAYFRPNSAIVVGSFQLMIDESAGWPAEPGGHGGYSDATIVPAAGRHGYAPTEFDDPGDSRAVGPGTGAHAAARNASWLQSNAKPLMFGTGAVVLASAIGLGVWFGGDRGGRVDPEVIAQHIVDAEDLLDQGEPARAISEHLDPVLAVEPDNEDALELKREAQARLGARGREAESAVPLPPVAPDPRPRPANPGPGLREPSQPAQPAQPAGPPPVDTAARELTDRIAAAQQSIDRGELARAEEMLRALPAGDSRVSDLQRLVRQRRRSAAEDAARQGAEEARNSRWLTALEAYERARQADPSFTVDAQVADVRAKMKQDADGRLVKADVEYRFSASDAGARQAALRLYQEAARLMSADHPRLAEVNQRIKELGGK
jgi:hypothetical protein